MIYTFQQFNEAEDLNDIKELSDILKNHKKYFDSNVIPSAKMSGHKDFRVNEYDPEITKEWELGTAKIDFTFSDGSKIKAGDKFAYREPHFLRKKKNEDTFDIVLKNSDKLISILKTDFSKLH